MADEMGQGKSLWYTHRLMHRNRVTCELHDSYFRLMTIKHAIPKIEWAIKRAIELLYNSVKTGSKASLGTREVRDKMWLRKPPSGGGGPRGPRLIWRSDELETRCGRESYTWPKGPSGPRWSLEIRWWQDAVEKACTQQSGRLGLRLSSPGERERHNADGHKSGSQYIAVFVQSPTPLSHTNVTNKVRGIFF